MKGLLFFFISLCSVQVFSSDLNIVAVGKAELEIDKIVFLSFGKDPKRSDFNTILKNDFTFYKGRFKTGARDIKEGSFGNPNMDKWKKEGIRYVSHINYQKGSFNAKVYDTRTKSMILSRTGSMGNPIKRRIAHQLSDAIYQQIVGKKSVFLSKIIFVSDRNGRKSNPVKELYIMDFDGKNIVQLTKHRGTVISPAISYDGSRVLYSLISGGKRKRNVNLYMMDIKTRRNQLVSSRKGINSGAVFTPDGNIMLTLSHQGNAELYKMDLKTKSIRRITKHYSPDVDPSINARGDKMAFLSGRAGKPMIYTMDPRGLEKKVKRISFVGHFNATPRFNPEGTQMAFSSWMDNRFDIFRVDANGANLYRLTKDFGSNEDPTYSVDGEFIAFSSQRVLSRRKAVQNIYIMTKDGEVVASITKNFGNCITPRWSK